MQRIRKTYKDEGGFLYVEALFGITIMALLIGAVMALLSTLIFQYNQASIRQKGLQLAISAIEEGKYKVQHDTNRGFSRQSSEDDLYRVEQIVEEKIVQVGEIKQLHVRVYYKEELVVSLATYVWEGFKTTPRT